MSDSKRFNGLMIRASLVFFFILGCARVSIDSKQPIKVDVTMRLDIYQHVSKDVDSIEDMISGGSEKSKDSAVKTSLVFLDVSTAYAEDESGYPQDVLKAIESRRVRRDKLVALEAQGMIGENFNGLVEVKGSGGSIASGIVSQENSDRKTIYGYIAKKNGASVEETGRISARRIQSDAPSGAPIESEAGSWTTKG